MPSIIITTFALAAMQAAVPATGDSNNLVSRLRGCRQHMDPAARLSCYDAAAGALDSAITEKKVIVLDREDVRETRRSLFGFNLPKLSLFGGAESGEGDEEEITTRITAVRSLGYGKWQIKVETGAVWKTTEAPRIDIPPKIGDAVRIRQGAVGSYFMNIAGRRAVRATRES